MNVPDSAADGFLAALERGLGGRTPTDALQETCRRLRSSFGHYNWVGIYLLKGQQLHLVAWEGKEATEHTTIGIEKGICGMAVREDRTVVVGDVDTTPEYLACFPYTKSEIVVPIRWKGAVVGEIDIDGDQRSAYDPSDAKFLERVAKSISPYSIP